MRMIENSEMDCGRIVEWENGIMELTYSCVLIRIELTESSPGDNNSIQHHNIGDVVFYSIIKYRFWTNE